MAEASDLQRLQAAWTAAPWPERGPLCTGDFVFRVCSHEGRVELSQPAAAAREHELTRRSPPDFAAEVLAETVTFSEAGWVVRRRLRVTGAGREVIVLVCHVVDVRDGKVCLFEEYYDPTELRAAFPERYYADFARSGPSDTGTLASERRTYPGA